MRETASAARRTQVAPPLINASLSRIASLLQLLGIVDRPTIIDAASCTGITNQIGNCASLEGGESRAGESGVRSVNGWWSNAIRASHGNASVSTTESNHRTVS